MTRWSVQNFQVAPTQALVGAFRIFANELRKPYPYFPIVTELKGASNLVIGFLQLSISGYMKYSQNTYYNSLATRHWDIGTEAMARGAFEFVPGFLVGFGSMQVAKANNVTITDIINPLNVSLISG